MVRRKSTPLRLSLAADTLLGRTPLEAFELRLANEENGREKDADVQIFMPPRAPAAQENSEHLDENDGTQRGQEGQDQHVKSRKRKGKRKAPLNPAVPPPVRLDSREKGSGDTSVVARLAYVELDLSASKDVGTGCVLQQLKLFVGLRNCSLFLENKDGATELVLEAKLEEDDDPRRLFQGSATYWMGGSEKEVSALAALCRKKLLAVPCRLERRPNGKVILCYSIHLLESFYTQPNRNSALLAAPLPQRRSALWHTVLEWVFPGSISQHIEVDKPKMELRGATQLEKKRLESIFLAIRPDPNSPLLEDRLLAKEVSAKLRPYQKRAVFWMLGREGVFGPELASNQSIVDSFFETFYGTDARPFDLCPFNGTVVTRCSGKSQPQPNFEPAVGGLLADEMGLGKTVEVIACIFGNRSRDAPADPFSAARVRGLPRAAATGLNCVCGNAVPHMGIESLQCWLCGSQQHRECSPDPKCETHVCPSCRAASAQALLRRTRAVYNIDSETFSAATLIVCPESIAGQWCNEIEKHTREGSARVLRYPGVRTIRSALEDLVRAQSRECSKQMPDSEKVRSLQRKARNLALLMWPQHLASYDIVVTTYDVLRNDLHHVATKTRDRGDERFALRNKKRFRSTPSPLGSVQWRRIIIDEAQEVETTTAACAEMALTMRTKYRWAVTGTPLGRHGIDDLFGLLVFLGISPINTRAWWQRGIIDPILRELSSGEHRLKTVLSCLMWRNTKQHVKHELELPPVTEFIHRVVLTPIEQHFYDQQHAEVHRLTVEAGGGALSEEKLFGPVLRLRQACCHPQIGSFGVSRAKSRAKKDMKADPTKRGTTTLSPISMSELHELLMGKGKVQAEEAQRLMFMNMNAVAGIKLLLREYNEAISKYTEILKIMDENKRISSDSLQRLHTMEGLRFAMQLSDAEGNGEMVPLTRKLYMEKLASSVADIRSKFLRRYQIDVETSILAFKSKAKLVHESSAEVMGQIGAGPSLQGHGSYADWWLICVEAIRSARDGAERADMLIRRLKLDRNSGGARQRGAASSSIVSQFSSLDGLKMVLMRELDRLAEAQRKLEEVVAHLSREPTSKELTESANCAECRYYMGKTGPECSHCQRKRTIMHMESLIFSLADSKRSKKRRGTRFSGSLLEQEADDKEDANLSYQYRDPCELLLILRILKSAAKSLAIPGIRNLTEAADHHFRLFELHTDELAAAWIVWQKRDAHLKAHDELEMAALRMELVDENESVEREDESWKLHPAEIPVRLADYELEAMRYKSQLKQCMSQLRYLESIKENSFPSSASSSGVPLGSSSKNDVITTSGSSTKGFEDQSCLICHERFAQQVAMLSCGHGFCVECIQKLRKFGSRCPTCRSKIDDVRYVSINVPNVTPSEAVPSAEEASPAEPTGPSEPLPTVSKSASWPVKGDLGSKLNAVVSKILALEHEEPDAKALVFSQWEDVLSICEHGLVLNDISYVRISGRHRYNDKLALFRNDPSVRVLLLPLKSGAKGLNLTEANHVFFTEPICNMSVETQAIGRVHRMGQKRSTNIHHFVVQNTIEDRIHDISRKRRARKVGDPSEQAADTARKSDDSSKDLPVDNAPNLSHNIHSKEEEQLTLGEIRSLFM